MDRLQSCDEQKIAIEEVVKNFLQREFGLIITSVKVLLDQSILVIRAENFVCPAEIKASAYSGGAALIHEAYTKQFDKSKALLVKQTEKITGKKIVSNQIGINFTSRDFLITFFLG